MIPNLGVIVLTTGGYALMTPFPGAMISPNAAMGPVASPSVSGVPFNLPFFMLGGGGVSSGLPGNITGYPSLAASAASGPSPGGGMVIYVGSGADDASAPLIPKVSRNTVAYDRSRPLPPIGGLPDTTSSLLPPAPAPIAPVAPPPTTSEMSTGPTMPPPGSSLKGVPLGWPSTFPGGPAAPPLWPSGNVPGGASYPAPLPPPEGGRFGGGSG